MVNDIKNKRGGKGGGKREEEEEIATASTYYQLLTKVILSPSFSFFSLSAFFLFFNSPDPITPTSLSSPFSLSQVSHPECCPIARDFCPSFLITAFFLRKKKTLSSEN